jgi:methylmalonyl-CoA/ethylmalonyl-CoA epimerase
MKFNNLNHIGVAVKDIEKTIDLLKENFEAEVIHEMASVEEGFQSALISLGELKLELMASLKEEGLIAEFINQRGEGIHHLSFQAEDLQATVSFLEGKGFKTIKVPSEVPGIHAIFLHPKSFFGILVEFFQRIG